MPRLLKKKISSIIKQDGKDILVEASSYYELINKHSIRETHEDKSVTLTLWFNDPKRPKKAYDSIRNQIKKRGELNEYRFNCEKNLLVITVNDITFWKNLKNYLHNRYNYFALFSLGHYEFRNGQLFIVIAYFPSNRSNIVDSLKSNLKGYKEIHALEDHILINLGVCQKKELSRRLDEFFNFLKEKRAKDASPKEIQQLKQTYINEGGYFFNGTEPNAVDLMNSVRTSTLTGIQVIKDNGIIHEVRADETSINLLNEHGATESTEIVIVNCFTE